MIPKRQNKIENIDISEKHNKINSLIHKSFNKFIINFDFFLAFQTPEPFTDTSDVNILP